METKGLKIADTSSSIFDPEGHVLSPTLADILEEVESGDLYFWAVENIDGVLSPEYDYSALGFEEKINKAEDGMSLSWSQLILLSGVFFQIWDTTILGSRNPSSLKKIKRIGSVYTTCDFVLTLFDTSFWEIYSKDYAFLDRLTKKFRDVSPLEVP